MNETLAFRQAQRSVESFAEELMKAHQEAMECRDCEDFLQLGIDAFHWLARADIEFHQAVYSEKAEHDERVVLAIGNLFRRWLEPCSLADALIGRQQARGFTIENLEKFSECRREVQAVVRSLDEPAEQTLPEELSRLRDEAISEHLNGETAEFI